MIDRADLIGLLLPALHATTVAAVPLADAILALEKPSDGITLTEDEARDCVEALDIAQDSVDDYATQFSDVDARIDGGETRAAAARMRALTIRLSGELP